MKNDWFIMLEKCLIYNTFKIVWWMDKQTKIQTTLSLESLLRLKILFHNSFSKLIFELKLSPEVICHWHKKSSANVTACLYWQRKLSELGQKTVEELQAIRYFVLFSFLPAKYPIYWTNNWPKKCYEWEWRSGLVSKSFFF